MIYNNRTTLKIKATSNSIISNYEWKVNDLLQENNTDILIIDTNTLPLGDNTVSLRVQSLPPCSEWSDLVWKTITIVEGENMEKTVQILVDEPTENAIVVMDYTGTVNVTVTDQLDRPVVNANVSIGTIAGTTDAFGKTVLNNVPYGSQTLTVVV